MTPASNATSAESPLIRRAENVHVTQVREEFNKQNSRFIQVVAIALIVAVVTAAVFAGPMTLFSRDVPVAIIVLLSVMISGASAIITSAVAASILEFNEDTYREMRDCLEDLKNSDFQNLIRCKKIDLKLLLKLSKNFRKLTETEESIRNYEENLSKDRSLCTGLTPSLLHIRKTNLKALQDEQQSLLATIDKANQSVT